MIARIDFGCWAGGELAQRRSIGWARKGILKTCGFGVKYHKTQRVNPSHGQSKIGKLNKSIF
jgi:hypothetical protein